MRWQLCLFVLSLMLSGCARQRLQQAQQSFAQAKLACKAQWPSITPETVVPYTKCVSDTEEQIVRPAAGNISDLISERIAYRNALADRVASGE